MDWGGGGRDSNRNTTKGKEYVTRRIIKYCNIKPRKRFTKYANYDKNDHFTHTRLAQITKLLLMLTAAQNSAVKILTPSWRDCGAVQSCWVHGLYCIKLKTSISRDSALLLGNPAVCCGQDIWVPVSERVWIGSHEDIYEDVHCFIGRQRQSRGPYWRMEKFLLRIYTREYYKGVNQDNICMATWRDLESGMLSENVRRRMRCVVQCNVCTLKIPEYKTPIFVL